ncbi:MAG: helix-turn-helix domain-containing protein [Methylobacter sp.]
MQANHNLHTQRSKILDWLQTKGGLSTTQARRELDIMHPGARVLELREQGMNIITFRETVEGHRKVARYVLLAEGVMK